MYEFQKEKYLNKYIGKMKIIDIDYEKSKGNKPWVLCKCNCGNPEITTRDLYSMSNKSSCGKCNRFKIIGSIIEGLEVMKEDVDNTKNMIVRCIKCGNESSVDLFRITHNKHIGCNACRIQDSKYGGLSYSRIYSIRRGMIDRCYNKNNGRYSEYGGRGISICREWMDKDIGFLSFYNWALENGYKENLTIDRIDVDGEYSPNNCRWADVYTQANNTTRNIFITINGATKTIAQFAREYKLNYNLVWKRHEDGITGHHLILPTSNKKIHTDTIVEKDGSIFKFKTQKDAGEFLGVSGAAINKYIFGKLNPRKNIKVYRLEKKDE